MTGIGHEQMKKTWEESFTEQIEARAYNTAAVEALVRHVSYYLRDARPNGDYSGLHFLEMGCGAGPNLLWLAQKGIKVSGVDISPTALALCRENFKRAGLTEYLVSLEEGSVESTSFADESFDGILESCVFQHLEAPIRRAAFAETSRLLKPGGVFCGYMLSRNHTVFQQYSHQADPADPGALHLDQGGSKFYLTDIGLSYFFEADEFKDLLPGFQMVDPCGVEYYLPAFEARKRGYEQYKQAMWALYAVK